MCHIWHWYSVNQEHEQISIYTLMDDLRHSFKGHIIWHFQKISLLKQMILTKFHPKYQWAGERNPVEMGSASHQKMTDMPVYLKKKSFKNTGILLWE